DREKRRREVAPPLTAGTLVGRAGPLPLLGDGPTSRVGAGVVVPRRPLTLLPRPTRWSGRPPGERSRSSAPGQGRQLRVFQRGTDVAQHLGAQFAVHEPVVRSEEHTSELQSRFDLVCRLLLAKKKNLDTQHTHLT